MQGVRVWPVFIVLALLLVGSSSVFTVDEREQAILFRFGEVVKNDYEPGINFKIPIVHQVRKFENRILTLDAQPDEFLTVEKKNVIVDFFMKWRISEVGQFYRATGGDQAVARDRMLKIIKDGIKSEFAKRTVQEVVSAERTQLMGIMTQKADQSASEFGVQIVDVRVKRIDLPEQVSASVYDRMRQERERTARRLRSEGAEEAEKIKSAADRERTVILAEAYAKAEEIRGAGDAEAADTYARAFNKDREFYSFYRSLEAYNRSIGRPNDILVLGTDDEFFRYMRESNGG